MKHFIALVPMAGQHEGKIGQHSTMQETSTDAQLWANNRFSRPAVIVEMESGDLSLTSEEATKIYKEHHN